MMFHWLARLYHKKRASFPCSLKLANSKEERGTLSCAARLYHKKPLSFAPGWRTLGEERGNLHAWTNYTTRPSPGGVF